MWDAVHRNLIDLEDHYSGKIIRSGFAARPVFHCKLNNQDLTINFSTARTKSGRKTYIDFSLTISSSVSITIAEKEWLAEQDSNNANSDSVIYINDDLHYIVLPANNRKIQKILERPDFRKTLQKFDKMAYLFVGKSGTICEFWTDKIDRDTEFTLMKNRIDQIQLLHSVLK